LLNIQGTIHPLILKAALYDYNNTLIEDAPAIGWNWLYPNANLAINDIDESVNYR
jgi:hypothetical protein